MSGVCGIWAPHSDRSVLSRRIQAGLDAMAHRGPDGFSIHPEDHVVLGHCLFDTGCNGMYVDRAGYALSFDGRLDNREALLSALRAQGLALECEWEHSHDKALLLAAYRHFGERLPDMLRGDFAFAIWDPGKAGLFLCRDHFGVKPLFWRNEADAFHFASEIKGLQAMAQDARFAVREQALAGFVAGDLDDTQPACTVFEGVYRLQPGHRAWLDRNGFKPSRYWSLDPALPNRNRNASAQFKALFKQAVDRRLRTTQPVGALLSGGLDSSSIVAMIGSGEVGRKLDDVPVFSLVFDKGEDESSYIAAVEGKFGFTAHRVDGSGISAFDDCDAITAEQDQPILGPNISTFRYFIRTLARQSGLRVLLDGHGGDEAVSYGNGIFQELAENGRWLRLWRELGKSEELRPRRDQLFSQLVGKRGLRAWRRRAGWLLRGKRHHIDDPIRYAPDGQPRPTEQAYHLSKLTAPLFAHALEGIDHNAAAAGIEIRMPFMDVDLVSFCVTLPASEKWAGGRSRAIVRKALAGILPQAIAERLDKFDFTDHVRNSMLTKHGKLIEHTFQAYAEQLTRFADLQDLRASWQSLQDESALESEKFQKIWRAVMLGRWFHHQRTAVCPAFHGPVPEAAE
jgi:asparagine synthase (glutamine-hydrolysing)